MYGATDLPAGRNNKAFIKLTENKRLSLRGQIQHVVFIFVSITRYTKRGVNRETY